MIKNLLLFFTGPDRNPVNKFQSIDRKSIKSVGAGGSGGRRSSSALGPVNSQSLGSNYTSATSGSSSGGKRSLQSGGSIDSSGVRDQSGLTKQMNLFLRTKSDSGKRLSDAVSTKLIYLFLNFYSDSTNVSQKN